MHRSLSVTPLVDPTLERVGFPLEHPYLEQVWLSVVGPTSVLALRHLGRQLEAHPEGVTVDLVDLSRTLGLQAKDSVDLLLRLGLLQREGRGKYSVSHPALSTGDEISSLAVAGFHKASMELVKRSIDRHPAPARDISGVTMSLSRDGFQRIKGELRAFRKKVMAIASEDRAEDMVYQLNLHFIPLTRARGAA